MDRKSRFACSAGTSGQPTRQAAPAATGKEQPRSTRETPLETLPAPEVNENCGMSTKEKITSSVFKSIIILKLNFPN